MAKQTYSLASFNRGLVSRLGLARTDVKRVALGASQQDNWMPRVLGSMMLRPGLGYIVNTLDDLATRLLRFIFATSDTALMEMTDLTMRVLIDDVLLTRPTVTAVVANGDFTASLASWTDNDEAGGVSQWVAPGYMQLAGDGTSRAIRDQQVAVVETGTEHALRIVIARGPVMLRVGSTSGGDDYINETLLGTGEHSLSFTPTGTFFVRFFSSRIPVVWVNSCNVEPTGVVELPTPWPTAALGAIRIEQSADVVFAACATYQPRRIERRGARPHARSWSIVTYQPEDGPFLIQNVGPVTITPSALTGNITLTASQALFKADHVGSLVSILSTGQQVATTSAVSGTATASIRVTGIDNARVFSVIIAGDASGSTVDLQRSYDNATWANIGAPFSWTANVTTTYDDGLDNQIVYYRLILTTRVAPDSVTMTLSIGSGSVRGIARITDFTTALSVGAEVFAAMGGTSASADWQLGSWSDQNGWPTAVRLQEGRLWWTGLNAVWGSISDTYDSFNQDFIGDAGPINRSIGSGPVDTINWILAVQRILLGAEGAEYSIRSSSFDEPITPTNFHLKAPSTQGSNSVDAVQIDQQGYFVNRSGARVYELQFDIKNYDYNSIDATALVPDLATGGIVRMDAQRQPDTRLHCVRADGVAMVMLVDKNEEVRAWVTVTTNGYVEDVCVLPAITGNTDDQVYYVVRREINGATARFIEKWAQESEARGGQLCRLADAHLTFTGTLTDTFSVPHLANMEVVVWADGADVGTDDETDPENWTQRYTADASGQVVLEAEADNVVIGLGYEAPFESTKLGLAMDSIPAPLNRHKNVQALGLIMADVHKQGLRFGPDFDHLDNLPLMEQSALVTDEVRTDYDEETIEFPGTWTTDSRLCLLAQAPRPCTVLAATMDLGINP